MTVLRITGIIPGSHVRVYVAEEVDPPTEHTVFDNVVDHGELLLPVNDGLSFTVRLWHERAANYVARGVTPEMHPDGFQVVQFSEPGFTTSNNVFPDMPDLRAEWERMRFPGPAAPVTLQVPTGKRMILL